MIKFKIYTIINNILLYSYWLLIAIVTFRILIKRRTIPSSMAWLLIIYILPLIGIITYFLFGESNLGKQRFNRSKTIWLSIINQIKELKIYQYMCTNQYSEIAFSLFQLCKNRQGIGALTGNKIKLLKNTNDIITSLTKDIKLARYTIDIVFYIWQPGGLVDYVANELIRAAKRGVRCRLILDSAGSTNFFRSPYHKIMKKAGVNIVKALHINLFRIFLRRMDLRQHRKMILIDNHIAYTGSMNMADPQLFKKKMGIGPWIDIMVRINGPVTAAMGIIFSSDWEIETGEQTILKSSDINIIKFKKTSGHTIQIIPSGPGFPEGMIHQALLTSLYTARKKIIITTPYLVPSDDLSYAICTAAQRGVEVHIIVPYHNDSILVNWASRAFFSEFLEAGVFIHQFHNGLLHVKSILIDQQLSFIGTVNLDIRSLCLNFEITLVIDDYNFSNDLELIQQEYITCSKLLDPKKWENRPYWKRIIERIFYFFSPLL